MDKTTQNNKKAELAISPANNTSVDSFISQAIATNAPVETLERLFTLHKDVKKEQAREAYITSLAKFQEVCPIIKKTKNVLNKDGRTVRFTYAPIDSVIEQIKKPLSANGFSYSWDVIHENSHMKVTCKLTHIMGHAETSTFEIPIVPNEYMSSPQSYATAHTYAKRYTLLNVLGIGTADEDVDAIDTGKDKDAKSTKSKIVFKLRQLGEKTDTKEQIVEAVKRLAKLGLEAENYNEIINRLDILIAERNEA